ncbi:alpha/beta fold hydrolase [Chitinivorax sp. PXF-14]|uniref:alpha/beta hydrolase n=1 Tax=Chitinivorax sp. PXF-14 TaxID=3230488 RepID=UPI0034650B26
MCHVLSVILVLLALASPCAAVQMPDGKYLDGKGSKVAVILAHGQGMSADSQVVSPLRKAINKALGFHTLSLQMPTLPGRISLELSLKYIDTFPDAYARIQAGIDFLKQEKGVERIYLMGYSMGGRMTTAFLANNPAPDVVGYIGVGLMGGGPPPLNSNMNLPRIKLPVIDVYAENDKDAQFAANRRWLVSERYVQVPIAGARHDYKGHEDEVVRAVLDWLRQREQP